METDDIDPEGLPVEVWDEYDAAAEGMARGVMPPVTLTTAALIDYDREEFGKRVRAFAYAHAMESRPQWRHDCDACKFLGQVGEVDVWWCVNPRHRNLDSVIGRYGDQGHEYASSHPPEAFADPAHYMQHAEGWYREAIERAKRHGLYDGRF